MFEEIKDYLSKSDDHYFRFYEMGDRGLIDIKIAGAKYGYRATFSGNVAHVRKGNFDSQTGEEFTLSENRIEIKDFNKIKELVSNKISRLEFKLLPDLLGFISLYSDSLVVQNRLSRINIGNGSSVFYTLVTTENGETMILKRDESNKAAFTGEFILKDDLDKLIELLRPYNK